MWVVRWRGRPVIVKLEYNLYSNRIQAKPKQPAANQPLSTILIFWRFVSEIFVSGCLPCGFDWNKKDQRRKAFDKLLVLEIEYDCFEQNSILILVIIDSSQRGPWGGGQDISDCGLKDQGECLSFSYQRWSGLNLISEVGKMKHNRGRRVWVRG